MTSEHDLADTMQSVWDDHRLHVTRIVIPRWMLRAILRGGARRVMSKRAFRRFRGRLRVALRQPGKNTPMTSC